MKAKQDQQTPATCVTCDFESFVKNNYFTGKMMGASEFIVESHYHQEKVRLHQARLHGWGVVCGLLVQQHNNVDCQKRYVRVEPGSAVDCCGHDILVTEEEMLDLLCFAPVAALAKENPPKLHALGVCIRFVECATEQVPVLYDDCGCDDDGCAPNRILESYAFEVTVDPPLGARVQQDAADLAGALFVRSPDTALGATTPRFGTAVLVTPAAGTPTLYAVDAGQPKKILAFSLGTLHATTTDLQAAIFGLTASPAADFAYVATAPQSGGSTPLVQIVTPGVAPLTPVPVTVAASGTNTVSIASSTGSNRAAIVYVRETGALMAFAHDAIAGLSAPTTFASVTANLSAFVTRTDGQIGYGIDAAGAVHVFQIAAAAPTDTTLNLAPGAQPTSLSYLGGGGQSWLLIGDRTNQQLYIVDLATNATIATISLDHPPEYLAATAAGMVYAVEEDGGQYLQAINAAPLAAQQSAVFGGARAIDGQGLRLVGLEKDSTAALLASTAAADGNCAGLVWAQLAQCGGCESANCLTLATIEHYQTGATVLDPDPGATLSGDITNRIARIDNREGRRVLASTATLQAWLECLQTQGTPGPPGANGQPGQNGKDGLGLYPDLPKILDIGWQFEDTLNLRQLIDIYQGVWSAADPVAALQQLVVTGGNTAPPLTVYFNTAMKGVTRRTLSVSIDMPMPAVNGQQQLVTAGVYVPIVLRLYGEIVEVNATTASPIKTPHTLENVPYAVAFLPAKEFFFKPQDPTQMAWPLLLISYLTALLGSTNTATLTPIDPPRVLVELRGDFVYAPDANQNYTELGVLDADNVGGRVGLNVLRTKPPNGGKNPSGDFAQGGDFASWFFLSIRDGHTGPMAEAARSLPFVHSFTDMLQLPEAPPIANLSSAQDLASGAGISASLAKRIVAARSQKPFAGVEDFRKRLKLSKQDWTKLQRKLVVF